MPLITQSMAGEVLMDFDSLKAAQVLPLFLCISLTASPCAFAFVIGLGQGALAVVSRMHSRNMERSLCHSLRSTCRCLVIAPINEGSARAWVAQIGLDRWCHATPGIASCLLSTLF